MIVSTKTRSRSQSPVHELVGTQLTMQFRRTCCILLYFPENSWNWLEFDVMQNMKLCFNFVIYGILTGATRYLITGLLLLPGNLQSWLLIATTVYNIPQNSPLGHHGDDLGFPTRFGVSSVEPAAGSWTGLDPQTQGRQR